MNPNQLNEPDWEPVVLKKKYNPNASKADVQAAQRRGDVEVVEKHNSGKNKKNPQSQQARKVEERAEEGDYRTEKPSMNLRKQIQQGRQDKKMTQADLAKQCNIDASIIRDYESGKTVPTGPHMQKMSKVLGVTLKKNP